MYRRSRREPGGVAENSRIDCVTDVTLRIDLGIEVSSREPSGTMSIAGAWSEERDHLPLLALCSLLSALLSASARRTYSEVTMEQFMMGAIAMASAVVALFFVRFCARRATGCSPFLPPRLCFWESHAWVWPFPAGNGRPDPSVLGPLGRVCADLGGDCG